MNVGFVGLGIMGKPMAGHLIHHGYETYLFDLNTQAVEELKEQGGHACDSLEMLAKHSDIIFTMLPAGKHVRQVLFDAGGLVTFCKPGTIIVDMSSTSFDEAKEFSSKLTDNGIHALDAPVSGGEPMALEGRLAIMVGGNEEDYQKALPLFQIMGENVVHVGEHGAGQIAKLANQIIVSTHLVALSEACVFASKAGLDLNKLFEVIRGGLAGSAVMEAKMPTIISRDFEPGGRMETNFKDLGNIQSSANTIGVPLPITNLVKEMFSAGIQNGHAKKDHSYVIDFIERLANHQTPKGGQ